MHTTPQASAHRPLPEAPYHLRAGSPAIGKAVEPVVTDQSLELVTSEYVHPLGQAERPRVRDVGAFEYAMASLPAARSGLP